jgi:predicted dehydrogenase
MHRRQCPTINIVAVCDQDKRRRDEVIGVLEGSTGTHPKSYADMRDALDDPDVEAVDIVLPTWLHHRAIIEAVSARKHVLVEKPLGITIKACDLVHAAARATNVVVAVAENYRRIPGNRAIGQLVRSGELGRALYMVVRNISQPPASMMIAGCATPTPGWYHDPYKGGAYQALEMGVHEADLIRYWFGDVDAVTADIAGLDTPSVSGAAETLGAQETLFAALRLQSGFLAQLRQLGQ